MLTLRGEVRILDLGLALFGAASEALDELTTVGQLMGTLDYMAPEQGDNSHDVDARADVYSLGATLFKLLTATAPYDSPGRRTPLAKMKALATIDAPSAAERREELPTELVAIVDRALLRNVEDRFASAKELADSLLPFCEGHVLSDLAECGRDLAFREDEKIPQPPTLPPFVQRADMPNARPELQPLDNTSVAEAGSRRRVAAWMLVPLILLAGIVIWIQTDNGTLVVESAEDGIPIEIRKGGTFHSHETLSIGRNELTIRSGTYEIVLPKDYESLTVENNVFTLKRGGEWVARISRKAGNPAPKPPVGVAPSSLPGTVPASPGTPPGLPIAAPGMSPGIGIPGAPGFTSNPSVAGFPGTPRATSNTGPLVFSGKTFEEWQSAVLTERNPTELKDTVQALCILGRNNRDAEAAAAVLQVVDAYDCVPRDFDAEGSLVAAAIRQIRTLNPTAVIPAIVASVRTRGANTRTLVLEYLAGGTESSRLSSLPDLGKGLPLSKRLKESTEFNDTLVDIFDELNPKNRITAFEIILEWFAPDQPGERQIEFFEKCLQHRPADGIAIRAARRLAEIRPTPDLADVFLDHLETTADNSSLRDGHVDNWWSYEADDWLGLATLGKEATGSVGRITRFLDDVPNYMSRPQTVYLTSSPAHDRAKIEIHRQLLPLEILAMIGEDAHSAIPDINKVLKALTGESPNPEGDYGFDGFRQQLALERLVLDRAHGDDAMTGLPVKPSLRTKAVSVDDRHQRLNSALVAIRRITGKAARFDVKRIGVRKSSGGMDSMGSGMSAIGGGYSGGGSAGMMGGYGGVMKWSEAG